MKIISNELPNDYKSLLEYTRKFFPEAKLMKFNFRTYEKHSVTIFFGNYHANIGGDIFKNPENTLEVFDNREVLKAEEGDMVTYEEMNLSEFVDYLEEKKLEHDKEVEKISNGKRLYLIQGGKK